MSINDFLSKSNIEMLWDLMMDEDIFKNRTKDVIININNLLNKLIKEFYESEKHKYNNLIDMNKQFIKIILNYINRLFPIKQNTQNIQNTQNTQNIQNTQNTQNKQLITSEDIQQNRMTQFEKELTIKQQEFTNAITLPLPPTPNFSDKLDEPISEMGNVIKQMMAQRKYDTEIFNQQLTKNDQNWLQSQETSIKNEKINKSQENNKNNNISNDDKQYSNYKVKYIKIDNKDIIDFDIQKEVIDLNKKQLSWSDNNTTIEYNEYNESDNITNIIPNKINNNFNILSKLKILPENNINNNNNNNDNDNNNTNNIKFINLENKVNDLSNKLDTLIELIRNKNIINL